ncbi:MAG: hypothetical protein WAZ77_09995 [Candidatus Nitrosopolaris sp.]
MLEAVQELLNFGFLGKGNDSPWPALMEQIAAGCWGAKTTRRLGLDSGNN